MQNGGRESESDPITGLHRACVPRGIGKYGFTTSCKASTGCSVHSPLETQPAEQLCDKLKTYNSSWDGGLHVSNHVCDEGAHFFVSYVATYGPTPINPWSLPACLHTGGQFGRVDYRGGRKPPRFKPVLWVINGAPLHALKDCSSMLWDLPAAVLARFPLAVRRKYVVWQPTGSARRAQTSGDCANTTAQEVVAAERRWLRDEGVASFDYPELTGEYGTLQWDGRHFSYFYMPCNETFPELSLFAGRLALQAALGRDRRVCLDRTWSTDDVLVAVPK